MERVTSCPSFDFACIAKELYNNGPVSSYAGDIYEEFYTYADGVFRESKDSKTRGSNHGGHVIKIGWGKEQGARRRVLLDHRQLVAQLGRSRDRKGGRRRGGHRRGRGIGGDARAHRPRRERERVTRRKRPRPRLRLASLLNHTPLSPTRETFEFVRRDRSASVLVFGPTAWSRSFVVWSLCPEPRSIPASRMSRAHDDVGERFHRKTQRVRLVHPLDQRAARAPSRASRHPPSGAPRRLLPLRRQRETQRRLHRERRRTLIPRIRALKLRVRHRLPAPPGPSPRPPRTRARTRSRGVVRSDPGPGAGKMVACSSHRAGGNKERAAEHGERPPSRSAARTNPEHKSLSS